MVLNSPFWKWILYPLEIQSFWYQWREQGTWIHEDSCAVCSGMSHCGPSQAQPFCDSGGHLRLQHWSLCSGGGGIHLRSENLCFDWFLNIAISERKTSYFMKDCFCLGFIVSVQRSQLWNFTDSFCRTLRFFLVLMSLVLDISQLKERILSEVQNIGKLISDWLLPCVLQWIPFFPFSLKFNFYFLVPSFLLLACFPPLHFLSLTKRFKHSFLSLTIPIIC